MIENIEERVLEWATDISWEELEEAEKKWNELMDEGEE